MDKSVLLEKINAGSFSEKELLNLKANAEKGGHQDIADAIYIQMRKSFPRAATKQFGAKGDDVKEMLEKIYDDIRSSFDLTKNLHKNSVKVGGDRISGKIYISLYISYKGDNGHIIALGMTQQDVESELVVDFSARKSGSDTKDIDIKFPIQDLQMAADLFKTHLSSLFGLVAKN
jgi:hypothetical protein